MPYAHPSRFPPRWLKPRFFYRSAGACPPRCPSASYVFRSFRTLMSIEKRVCPFSRSFRSLIKWQRGEPLHIKVLQTLGCSVVQAAIDIKVFQTLGMARDTLSHARMASEGPCPTMKGRRYFYRSAGACPPRSLTLCGKCPQPVDPGCLRLSPVHGEGQALALR